MSKPLPVEIGDDPERVALQCDGEVHGYLIRRRILRMRCRARRCGGRGGTPVYHDFDLPDLLRRLGYTIEKQEE